MGGEYWAVNQILAKELHNTDEGILSYTTALIDKLEQVRIHHAGAFSISPALTKNK